MHRRQRSSTSRARGLPGGAGRPFYWLSVAFLIIFISTTAYAAAPRPQDDGQAIPLAEYWERLRRTRQELAGLLPPAGDPAAVDPQATASPQAAPTAAQSGDTPQATLDPQTHAAYRAALDRLAGEWEAVTAIQMPELVSGAEPALIDTAALVAALRQDPPDPQRVIQVIDGLLAYEQDWGKSKFTAAQVETLQKILNRPEFQWQTAQPNLLQQLWERLIDALLRLFDRLFGSGAVQVGLSFSPYVWLILGVLAALLVLLLASRGLWRSLVRDEALAAEGDAFDQITADAALRRAQELSGAGDYRQGVRYLYLSALLLLEEHGLLRYDRSRTNREVLRSVAHRPELSAPLQRVVEVFDRVWYGYQTIGQEEFDAYTEDVAELRRQR